MVNSLGKHPFFIRLFNWEYWPFHVVYAPIYPVWFWFCLRARSFFFFSAANPTIENGGFLMESKKKIYDLIPAQYYPKTIFFPHQASLEEVWQQVENSIFQFPLVGKPDIGGRGRGVKKLLNKHDVLHYALHAKADWLLQEFVPYDLEAGIFYYRYPGKSKGIVSGIVAKEFLSVTGDGISTIRQLMMKERRHVLQLEVLAKTMKEKLEVILPAGKKEILVPYGNHCRGAKFVDVSAIIDESLTATIDKVCRQIDGFYYGRMDIRFNCWETLKKGKDFSIIELNGAGSEPTHIYDSNHSIFFAWKEIIRHWNILYKISMRNRHQHPFMHFSDGIRMFKQNRAYEKLMDEEIEKKPLPVLPQATVST